MSLKPWAFVPLCHRLSAAFSSLPHVEQQWRDAGAGSGPDHSCLPVARSLHQLCGQAKLLNLSVLSRCCFLEKAEHGVERWLELMSVKGLKQCLANRKYAIHFEYYY